MILATSGRRNILRALEVCATACLFLFSAQALESQQPHENDGTPRFIERIEIVGNRRVQAETIRAKILWRPGDVYNAEAVQRDGRALRDTGHFTEVHLRVGVDPDRPNGKIVVFDVIEKTPQTSAQVKLEPSSQELHNRYGEPDRERFAARPRISLTVEYGSDHLACSALIQAPQPLTYTEEPLPHMSSEGVSEVLEEVAPVAMRGKRISGRIGFTGCIAINETDYENVSLSRSTYTCDPSNHDQDVGTTIIFKREICPRPKTPTNRPYMPD